MKGVSGIVATAILLALTIAGGLLLYTYVSRYLATSIQSGELVIDSAYYLTPLGRLDITVRNIGMSAVNITTIEVILANNTSVHYSVGQDKLIAPGETRTISVNIMGTPRYVIVHFNDARKTEPATVRIIS